MVLSQQDIEKAHDAFEKFDVDHSGCIDAWELKEAMKSLGQNPTDEEVFGLLAQVDTDGSGNIDFQVMSPAASLTSAERLAASSGLGQARARVRHSRLHWHVSASVAFDAVKCLQEFLQVIEKQRESQGDISEDWDMISAFVALGGNPDKSGGQRPMPHALAGARALLTLESS